MTLALVDRATAAPIVRHLGASPALDTLAEAGTLDGCQRAAGLAYARLRRRFHAAEKTMRTARRAGGVALPEPELLAIKRRHAALLRAAGPDRFALDRLCLDDDAPLRCEVERVKVALARVAELLQIR